jgi:transcriptional regulator with XRE-family HTH domain
MRFVADIRKKSGLSQSAFARELGISRQALEWLENQASERIGIPNLLAIYRASKLSAEEFMGLLEKEERVIEKAKKEK